jgi:SAM-dependent methyltransferase
MHVDPDRERAELRAYLGAAYDESRLQRWEVIVDEELERVGDEQAPYRTSEAYLYNLTAFAMTRTKEPYLAWIPETVPPPARVLDMGCGIGSDGLLLAEHGYDVTFADFDNPSLRYLRWRLARRGLTATVVDVDEGLPEGPFDLAYAFDVVEHVPDPEAFLTGLEERARHVLVNLLEPRAGDTAVHHDLDIPALLRRRPAMRHEIFHGRSHLLLYGGAR